MISWPDLLGKIIGKTEARVASYKKLVGEAYKNGDRELVQEFKKLRQDEEKCLKRLRFEKTCLNAGVWEWAINSKSF